MYILDCPVYTGGVTTLCKASIYFHVIQYDVTRDKYRLTSVVSIISSLSVGAWNNEKSEADGNLMTLSKHKSIILKRELTHKFSPPR